MARLVVPSTASAILLAPSGSVSIAVPNTASATLISGLASGADIISAFDGGSTGQVLKKLSNSDYHADWDTLDKTDVGLNNVDNTSDANKPVSIAQLAAIAVVQADVDAHEADLANPHATTKAQVGLSNVDNTSDINKPVSTAQGIAIAVIQSDIDTHEANLSNPHSVTKTQVGLSNADNTSDVNKPVSTLQAAAIAVVQADVNAHEADLANPHAVTKAQVGLSNVDNTSDVTKPISTATQTALDLKAPLASPALTGNPTAPTQTPGNNSTRLATTAYVDAAVSVIVSSGSETFESVSTNLKSYDVIASTYSPLVTTKTYNAPGGNIVVTTNFTAGLPTTKVLTGAGLPSGIDTICTYDFTGVTIPKKTYT